MTFVASHVQKLGWNGRSVLDAQYWTELNFWSDNVRSLDGALMRTEGGVRYLTVRYLVSDASDVMVGAAEFVVGVENVKMHVQEPLNEDYLCV